MVIADDERRYVDVNPAGCLLFRLPEEAVLKLRIEDVTPPENRPQVPAMWDAFIRAGVQQGTYELAMPDGARVAIEYSATANVEPGRHLSIMMIPAGQTDPDAPPRAEEPAVLTEREREVLAMVALGRGSSWIAAELGVSPSTVETHVRHCLEKLGARNRAHAIALAIQSREIALELGPDGP